MLAEGIPAGFIAGACEIDLARRELRIHGVAAPLGGRAFEIVEVLALSAGKLVTKDELMSRVWPGAFVAEGTLHVHVVAIRKALGQFRALLKTESRRGYRLLGDWVAMRHETPSPSHPRTVPEQARLPPSNLPAMIARLIGRSCDIERLQDLVSAYRIVCLTGPGGIGKTTLGLEVARRVRRQFDEGAWFVELASLADPALVPSAVAGALGLRLGSQTISAEAVAQAIATRKLLLVLDNCEHLIGAVGALIGVLARRCPRVAILATSREILRIDGEYAYRVPALGVPAREQMDASEILAHSAPQLFLARASELGSDFSSDPASLRMIASISRRLDGIPLALELAAAQAAILGTHPVDTALSDRIVPLTNRGRAALARHRTLRATLDWSYDLLSGPERDLLQRLAVFSASFSLAAATAVINREAIDEADILDGIVSLVAKSLVTSDTTGGNASFRLLGTTRDYASSKLAQSGALAEFSRRHAEYYCALLERIESEHEKLTIPLSHIDNVRVALEWCFSPTGDRAVGVRLAAAATPVFLALSLFRECQRWAEQAIGALDRGRRGGKEEMQLQTSLGVSLMQMRGQSDAAYAAMGRGLAIARVRGDVLNQVGLLGMLSMFHVRDGDFITSLRDARLSRAVDGAPHDPPALALANSILGRALQFVGEHDASRTELEASLRYWSRSRRVSEVYLGLDHHILVGIGLARNLWFQGYPARARQRLRQTIQDAEQKAHPASLGLALSWAPLLFMWLGDRDSAAEHAEWLDAHAKAHSFGPYIAVARGYKGALAVSRGDAGAGIVDLEESLAQLQTMRYRMLSTGFRLTHVQGLLAIGLPRDALALADGTIRLIGANGDLVHLPEALRVKATALLALPDQRTDEAEACLTRSLDCAQSQAARSWELRAGTDMARLWVSRQRKDRARCVLAPILERFSEGLETPDLVAATELLGSLG